MKHYRILFLPALCLSVVSPAAFSQENELDITIRVMNENEQPSEFVQRLELPPPENFDLTLQNEESSSLTLDDEVSSSSDDITATANASEAISINTIIDNISINGAGADATVDNATNLPEQVVDILDEDLPLNTDLTDTVDDTTGEIVDVIDDIPGGDITDGTDDIVDDLEGDLGETGDDVSGGIVDTVDDIDNPTNAVDDTVSDLDGDLNDAGETDDLPLALDDLGSPPIDEDSVDIPQNLTDGL